MPISSSLAAPNRSRTLRASSNGNAGCLNLGSTRLFRDTVSTKQGSLAGLTPGTLIVGIGADLSTRIRWSGMPTTHGEIAVSGGIADAKGSGAGQFFSVAVDEKGVVDQLLSPLRTAKPLQMGGDGYLVRNPVKTQRLRTCVEAVFALADIAPAVLGWTSLQVAVERAVVELLKRAIAGRWIAAPCTSLGRRARAVRGCELYMRMHIDESISLRDLCDFSGLRPRSLISAFEAFTGFTPMAYLKVQRLAGVRTELASKRRDFLRIIDVAMDWGFVHMGHFAADYREMFGEKPSDTRNAARSSHRNAGLHPAEFDEPSAPAVAHAPATRRCLANLLAAIADSSASRSRRYGEYPQ